MTARISGIGAVVVAAGRGERAGDPQDGPKQYRRIGSLPVLAHTLQALAAHPAIGPIVVVIHADDTDLFDAAVAAAGLWGRLERTEGGATRQMSVQRGLEMLDGRSLRHVLIHDGVRPFVNHALIDRIVDALDSGAEAVLPALPVTDTLKSADATGRVTATVSRAGLYGAQTPQGFAYGLILAAHRAAADHDDGAFTDDASIMEWAGIPVRIVPGSPANLKLTVKEDLVQANEKLKQVAATLPDVRTGNGYDVHALVEGDGVTLCGVFIPHDRRLDGHSDADVGYHALTDALLATCGAGDIGDHFPPSDPQWKGAASATFLTHAAGIVRAHGGTITHADVSLICEAPRVGPHRQAMREAIARDLGIDVARCSVKATTNERIGFVGRGEGIAAIATATVVFGSLA